MTRKMISELPADAKPIPHFPGYFADPSGQIYSANCNAKAGRYCVKRYGKNLVGYPICGMKRECGALKFALVHRIIAKLFVPGDHSLEINHRDMVKTNCAASNLEWVTHSANQLKGYAMKPEWRAKIKGSIGRRVVATNPLTGEQHEFASYRAAAHWLKGNDNPAGNISKAIRSGRESYGFIWRFA